MKKYLGVFRLSLTERLAFKFDAFFDLLFGGATILLAWLLWKAVFAGREEVGGFTLSMMTTYYLVASFSMQFDQSDGYAWEFSAEIRNGSFGKYLSRPLDPLRYFLSACAGRGAFRALLVLAAAALWSVPFSSFLVAPDPVGLLAALPLLVLGLAALALINFMTALRAMIRQDTVAFRMITGIVIQFLSGGLIPLALLPGWAQGLLGYTPFPALASLPAMLWLGKGSDGLMRAYLVTGTWVAVLALAAGAAYRALSERYEEVGG